LLCRKPGRELPQYHEEPMLIVAHINRSRQLHQGLTRKGGAPRRRRRAAARRIRRPPGAAPRCLSYGR
jgi:hypothetical protein